MPSRLRRALVKRYRAAVHPALQSAIRRRLRKTLLPQPSQVSLVVPFYNVEPYFAACLTSLVRQSYRNLQIILVDDGSGDGSLDIARSYARWDRRIRIIRQPNAGLGAARNTGIAEARGRYLGFVDSDDTLPRDAVSKMVRTLERTGSDFAVGALRRMWGKKREVPPWVRQVHGQDRLGITLDEFPDVLRDVFAWNKLFDREFFLREVREFPEGIRYEDQEATARAYVSGTFDVLRANVYNWRRRDDGTSLTQQKANPVDLADRLVVKSRVSRVISQGASEATFSSWLAKAVGFDSRPYYEQVPRTDLNFWAQLRSGEQGLAELITDDIWREVTLVDRYPALATLADARDDVITFLTRRDEYGWSYPGVLSGDTVRLDEGHLDELGYRPDSGLLDLAAGDLRLVARLTDVEWIGPRLLLTGIAYLTNVDSSGDTVVAVDLVDDEDRSVAVPVRRYTDPAIDREANDAWNSHASGGFEAEIETTGLDRMRRWSVRLTVRVGAVERTVRLHDRDMRGRAARLPVAPATADGRWVVSSSPKSGLRLQYRPNDPVAVRLVAVTDETVELHVTGSDPVAIVAQVEGQRRTLTAAVRRDDTGQRFTLTFPAAPASTPSQDLTWRLQVQQEGEARDLVLDEVDDLGRVSPPHRALRVEVRPDGRAVVWQSAWCAVVEHIVLTERRLVLEGSLTVPRDITLSATLVGGQHVITSSGLTRGSDDSFTAIFDLTDTNLPSKRFGYSVRIVGLVGGRSKQRWLRLAPSLEARFPMEQQDGNLAATYTRTRTAGALWVRFRHPYAPDERGRLAQRRLHAAYQSGAAGGVRPAALFESFNGKATTDSPRALYEELRRRELGLDLYWTVDDLSRPVPDGAEPLLLHSRRWMEVLFSARYLINNTNFAFYFRKQPGQTYVQTWHGTPLKRIGNDVPLANLSLPYRAAMQREVGYWDVLLAQNEFAAEVLPAAFGYAGDVITEGYPRNDELRSPDTEERRLKARDELGLDPGTLAVLYAPTWRDTVATAQGYSLVSYLDEGVVRRALGERCRILLRGHANTIQDEGASTSSTINVTSHPSINDLFLAADVLVTDYSSVMFDFVVTGKPMIFLTPDLETYRDKTRGFYFDLAGTAPGPICRTTEEVVACLQDLDRFAAGYGNRYDAFRTRYASRDDGDAARRVADLLWPAPPV